MPINIAKYDNDVRSLFLKLIPYFWRISQSTGLSKSAFVQYMNVIAGSLDYSQQEIERFIAQIKAFTDVTGQHLSLEKYLNDTYDNTLRRIYITENDIEDIIENTWYLTSESDPENKIWYMTGETDPENKIMFLTTDNLSTNFRINIPLGIISDENLLIAQLSNYVQAGKNYELIYF